MTYNSEEQKRNINELYNNADGNDDILSDIDSGDNIRHGMWAISPYGVEDGDGVVNEIYDRKFANSIAAKFGEKYGFKVKSIGGGENGVAYDIGNNRVLKITGDRSEAMENLKLIGKPLEYIAIPYEVHTITSKSNPNFKSYGIILEKLQTNAKEFERLIERMSFAFKKILGVDYQDIILNYVNQPDFSADDNIMAYLNKNPKDAEFFFGIVRIAEELKEYGIKSVDYINPENLGYKPSGALGFFDVGFSDNDDTYEGEPPQNFEIDEDGSSKFSQTDSMGRDDFPSYDQNDMSPSIQNDLNANSAMYNEDLEYNHASDATQDEYEIDERVLSAMNGSSTVNVKKKCRLGGLGNSSAACNQGDIGNLEIKSLDEEIDANELYGENSNEKSIQAMIDGKKSIAFVNLTPELSNIVKNNGYRTIKVEQKRNQELNMHIVYYNDGLNRERAMRLYDIARSHEGYLKAYSPNEEREIGNLLGYSKISIENHINDKFGKKIPEIPVMPEKSLEDFDLDENIETENEIKFTDDELLNTFLNKLNQKEPLQRNPFLRRELMYGEKGSLEFSRFNKEDTNEIELSDIVAYEKSQGVGSTMMKDIIDVADEMNVKLTLTAKPFGNDPNGLKLFPLINFYKKFGFQADLSIFDGEFEAEDEYLDYVKEYPDEGFDMYREPNGMNEMINEGEIMSLQELPFKDEIQSLGGQILSVGGAVRDEFLGKESKDLDILITGVPMEQLEQILSKYGKVDAVGKSFGILKFKSQGATEEIDVAIPRQEKSTGEGGHKGFDVVSNHELPIEDDLMRRDLTINAMAKDMNGNIIDPFGGQEDLNNKIIRVVNPEAFSDDPLRMLRAVQFASRFGFTIEPKTMEMIKANASRIVEIPPERILTEFDKIVKKGNRKLGAVLLDETGLFSQIFGRPPYYSFEDTIYPFDKVKTMGEFVFLLMYNTIESPEVFYKNNLNGDIDTYKELRGLKAAFEMDSTNPIAARSVAHNMYLYSPQSLQSQIIPNTVQRAAQELLQGKYPKNSIELAVNGNDLMNVGLKGKEIGDMQKSLLLKVYGDKVKNDKEELLGLVGGNEDSEPIDEAKNKWYDYKYDGEPFYFDPETLSDAKWQVLTNLLTKMGWQARPYIEWKKYFLEKGAGTIPNDILRNTDSSDSTKIAAIKKVITPNKKSSESQNIITKAKRYFGMTNMFSEAGYLLQDGTMLNFSGQKFGGSPNRRDMDHREVNIIDTDMVEFMALGNIRMQSYGFELTQEPTREQINTLRRFIGSKNGEVTVDFSKKGQYSVDHSVEYQSGTNVSRIINDIVNYYRTGIKPISKPNLTEEINNVLYSAVVLDEQSRAKLLKVFRLMIPEGWEIFAHHMTINMGAIKPQFKDDLGDETDLSVLDYAIDDKVMAVGVEGYPTTNTKAHITIAVNRNAGGKPVMSNNLTDWKEINFKIELKGIITEIKK